MLSSKIDYLKSYNKLLKSASKGSADFPDFLCDYLVDEFEIYATVIFIINENDKLVVIGKSREAKKEYTQGSLFDSEISRNLNSSTPTVIFNSQFGNDLTTTDFVLFEGYLYIKTPANERLFFLLAKKTPYNQTDKKNLEIIGEILSNIISIWKGKDNSYNKSVGKILSEIAHEIRTPVNSIMGFASLLNEDNLTSSQAEYVNTLKESSYNLLTLLNDLIDIAKVDSGQLKETVNDTNIKDFINNILKGFREKIDKNKLDFLLKIDKELPDIIKLDSQKLKYALINIITYSIRLTDRGKITISIAAAGPEKINLKISDTSSGLSSNKIKEIFNPFSIFDLGNTKLGNTSGIALTLSKRYIELLDGQIYVTSSLGKGTTYNITLPVKSLSPVEAQISTLPKPVQKNRVLVVEDDYATSKLLSNYLNKWGYYPVIVNSAEQTLKIIEKESFLAVLMDIVLPDTNGFDLLQKIREHKNTKNTPVIICSVEAEQQKAFLMGAVEYFVKPIKYNFLVEVLQSYRLKKDSDILIVDDDVPTLNLIKEAVQQAGFNPIAESNSSKVLEMIDNLNLDLAIIDLDMPEVNGFELIKGIKSNPKFATLPIVIYTGKENYQDDLKKIDGLFEELLEKNSTNIEDLAGTITGMINRIDETTAPPKSTEKDVVKILLVEDYKHSQIIVTRLLKKNNFEHIIVVENGAEALDQVKKEQFDLILMDMQMPVMNGFEATEKIRQIPSYQDTPIIALTAFAMKGDREKCLEAGATDYIPKPIDSHEFIEKVKYYTDTKITVIQ